MASYSVNVNFEASQQYEMGQNVITLCWSYWLYMQTLSEFSTLIPIRRSKLSFMAIGRIWREFSLIAGRLNGLHYLITKFINTICW